MLLKLYQNNIAKIYIIEQWDSSPFFTNNGGSKE